MTRRGNITFQSFECEYNDLYEAYIIDDDIKNDVQVLADHYTYSGYYMVLNKSFWENLSSFILMEKLSKKEFNIAPASFEGINVSFSDFKELKNLVNDFSSYITKRANLNVHALFNMINIKRLNLFEDFMAVFFNEQNKKVRKSFLNSYGMDYLDEYYDDSRRYEYFAMFDEYFGDRFSKFIDDELRNYGINEEFSTLNVIDSIFSKFSDDQLSAFINRLNFDTRNYMLFNPFLVFNGEELLFVFMWDEFKKEFKDFEVLWIDFLLTLGFNVEIFAFNKSRNSLSRFVNKFRENKVKLELFNHDNEFKLEKSDITDFKQLKNEIANLNEDNTIIKIDGEEVNLDEVNDVFSCTLEKEDNGLSKDYCCKYGDSEPSKFPCKYVEEYFNFIFNVGEGFGQINDEGILKFNKDKIRDKYKELSKTMKICPFFDFMDNKKALTKYLKNINPKTMKQWCFVDGDGHSWYFLRKMWFSDEANLDFPGFSKMAGVKKTDKQIKDHAVKILDKKLKEEKQMGKNKNQKSLLDF